MLRNKSKFDPWVIIISTLIVLVYSFLYSLVLLIFSDYECRVTDNNYVDAFTTQFTRIIQYNAWLYPYAWVFWPRELTEVCFCPCCKKPK